MFKTIQQKNEKEGTVQNAAGFILQKSNQYLSPLLEALDAQIDARLVRTFYNVFMIIQTFRNVSNGLLLSELGGYICGFDKAPAGTKRISNLLRSDKWEAKIVDEFLFEKTKKRGKELVEKGKKVLFIWDDSRIEKPESWFSQGLCSVYSSKAQRLTRIKPGYYCPPGTRICTPGFKWTGVLISGLGEVPAVCAMSWWTTRGKFKEIGSNIMYRLLRRCQAELDFSIVHVLDRGYANQMIIEWMFHFEQDFIVRWKANHKLVHENGQIKQTHLVSRSYKGKNTRTLWDKERKKIKKVSIAYAPVYHPEFPDNQLFMVIVRDKNNYNSPMYLLTSLPIISINEAWEVCFSYIHRWSIEQTFRAMKSELAVQSIRLWSWENRLKLLAIVALVYDFLMSLIRNWSGWIFQFLRNWGHRTGKRYQDVLIPFYRLRAAIATCMLFCLAQNCQPQNSG